MSRPFDITLTGKKKKKKKKKKRLSILYKQMGNTTKGGDQVVLSLLPSGQMKCTRLKFVMGSALDYFHFTS